MTRMTTIRKHLMIGGLTIGLAVTIHSIIARDAVAEQGTVGQLSAVAVVPSDHQILVRRGLVRGHRDVATADSRSPGVVETVRVRRGVNRTALVPNSASAVNTRSVRRGTRISENRSRVPAKVASSDESIR